MIGESIQDNLEKKPNSREMEKLKKDFPQFFTKEGEFKLDLLKDFLREEEIDISKEGYELKFLGKSYAKYLSSLETETYLSPDSKHNAKDENKNSENLYIVGDNLDALKHLLGSYSGKIKCIYIDPPYNTGSDGFVYPDNFQFKASELADKIGMTEEEAERILNLAGKSTHSAWLTFMYPRLILARDLLTDDGVIFISIDDNEQANLKLMCDEIFGEGNAGNLIWQKQDSKIDRNTNSKTINRYKSINENVMVFYKNKSKTFFNKMMRLPDWKNKQKNIDNDPRGNWQSGIVSYEEGHKNEDINSEYYFSIKSPSGIEWTRHWFYNKEQMNVLLKENRIYFGSSPGYSNVPRLKTFENEEKDYYMESILRGVGTSSSAKEELEELLGGRDYFDTPKPMKLVKEIIRVSSDKSCIVLDFFSGSATAADAVMQLNEEDGGSRKYILVQLPEKIEEKKPAYNAGYRSIDEIGRARIEKAAAKIKKETGADIDYGYKLYFLENPDEKTLVDLENFVPDSKFLRDDMVSIFDNDHSKGKVSILATWLNEDGYGLTKTTMAYKLEHYEADLIEKSLYIIDQGLGHKDVMTLIKRIENEELEITRVVAYVHSIDFDVLHELRKNLKVLRNNKNVTLIERF
ncbi:site-specific DNA-methyltransferase [Aedoeadaptatus acetigenes]|uniref:Site-specific DNA-methyltransferase n=1 Tax=Aedoeadaptatus acetigenes TaxID=2981723 RepID=A0ABV1J771_9FIRM